MAVANPGLGTLLKLSISAVFTTVAQRVTLDGPSMEMGTAETTTLDSTVKTYRPTILDNGEISGTLFFDPQDATHVAMKALLTVVPPIAGLWKLQFIDTLSSIYSFSGILTKLQPNGMEVESVLGADFAIKVTGAITETHS